MKHPITNIKLEGEHRRWLGCDQGEFRFHTWMEGDRPGDIVYKNPIHITGRRDTRMLRADGPMAKPILATMMAEYPRLKVEHAAWLQAKQEQDEKDHRAALRVRRATQEAPAMLTLLKRLKDAVEALDGTSVDNEKIVDDYRALIARIEGE